MERLFDHLSDEHTEVNWMMQVKLKQIAMKAKQDKRVKFSALMHHINEANLADCYQDLKRNKACGIDGVTVEAYGKDYNTPHISDHPDRHKKW